MFSTILNRTPQITTQLSHNLTRFTPAATGLFSRSLTTPATPETSQRAHLSTVVAGPSWNIDTKKPHPHNVTLMVRHLEQLLPELYMDGRTPIPETLKALATASQWKYAPIDGHDLSAMKKLWKLSKTTPEDSPLKTSFGRTIHNSWESREVKYEMRALEKEIENASKGVHPQIFKIYQGFPEIQEHASLLQEILMGDLVNRHREKNQTTEKLTQLASALADFPKTGPGEIWAYQALLTIAFQHKNPVAYQTAQKYLSKMIVKNHQSLEAFETALKQAFELGNITSAAAHKAEEFFGDFSDHGFSLGNIPKILSPYINPYGV